MKKWFCAISIAISSLLIVDFIPYRYDTKTSYFEPASSKSFQTTATRSPQKPERERRDHYVTPFLTVAVGLGDCSGSIVYYDDEANIAYAIGCAHCYDSKYESIGVRTYFVNGRREIHNFKGNIIAYDPQSDLCIITFKPNFEPDWVPIGIRSSPYFYPTKAPVGDRVIVTGRDAGLPDGDRRPAAYEAFIREVNSDKYLKSNQSQSRGGRSGGGVITTNRKWLIGVNHGRGETIDGIGEGRWIPLHTIHKFLKSNRLEWLLSKTYIASRIPIHGIQNIPPGYIPSVHFKDIYVPLDGGLINIQQAKQGTCCFAKP